MLMNRLRPMSMPLSVGRRVLQSGGLSQPQLVGRRVFSAVTGGLGKRMGWRLGHLLTRKIAVPLPFVLFGGSVTLQYYIGSSDDFFYGSFITEKDPDALAEFYQAEDLLKIIAIHPIIFDIFMNKVDPDATESTEETKLLSVEETKFKVKSLGMEVSFEIIQTEEEIDGETVPTTFQRHERFIDWVPLIDEWFNLKFMLWDQIWTYGFKRLDNGKYEVYHHGEKFVGPWPIRIIVFFHQYYVLWGCEKFINGQAFGTEDLDKIEEELAFIPLVAYKDLMRKLETETLQTLEGMKSERRPDRAAIQEELKKLEKIKELQDRDKSTITVAKRPGGSGSMARSATVKVIAEDKQTAELINAAMQDRSKAVGEMLQQPGLEFKKRSTTDKKIKK